MNADELMLMLQCWLQPELDGIAHESAQSAGSTYLRERLMMVAERCTREFEGDLAEIGCLNGSTTVRLAEVARLHGRRVVAVDPWEPGTQNCTGEEYGRFVATIAPYADVVDVVRLDSRSAEAKAILAAHKLAFAFVDGLHEYQACLSDIWACRHACLIAVDDYTWNEGVKRAWYEGTGTRHRIELPPLHEGYIL